MTAPRLSMRCACPCRRRLPADGRSLWFATEKCQARWHAAKAHQPPAEADAEEAIKPEVPLVLEADYDRYLDALRAENPAIATPDEVAAERAHAHQLAARARHRRRTAAHLAVGMLLLAAAQVASAAGWGTAAAVCAGIAVLPVTWAAALTVRAHRGALARTAPKETETR